ncbi:ACR3 family arsenite efflux pump ArsB [Agromyces atrinae]|uniref:ACR3 family arsenite efflux pump ArsB n=2 Tax=Agromyces atrinae TaxID=592376 RepID=A0A852SLW1_9MICO|nr:ACR3 family arsenite efflux pump ArsB [Agromyces atrinae]
MTVASPPRGPVGWMERRQIALYLAAIALGAGIGLVLPGSEHLEVAITPVLGLLLFATFLAVPFASLGRALRDVRFLGAVLVLNFLIVPIVAFGLSRFVSGDPGLVFGVLLVLLTPCIDYVIVFTGLAGGAATRLLAATPLLMIAQMLLLPVYLVTFIGAEGVAMMDVEPFVVAFVSLIVLPLAAAAAVQALARRYRAARAVESTMGALMVPLMMATLAVVVASQIAAVSNALGSLLVTVPIFIAFAIVMVPLGDVTGRLFGVDTPARRAVVFSGATRNSLVVLPLALAAPDTFAIAPTVVVTQTLVELVAMVVFVRVIPALIRSSPE